MYTRTQKGVVIKNGHTTYYIKRVLESFEGDATRFSRTTAALFRKQSLWVLCAIRAEKKECS